MNWINVKDRFPTKKESKKELLLYTNKGNIELGKYIKDSRAGLWCSARTMYSFGNSVTYWKSISTPIDDKDIKDPTAPTEPRS